MHALAHTTTSQQRHARSRSTRVVARHSMAAEFTMRARLLDLEADCELQAGRHTRAEHLAKMAADLRERGL